MNDQRGTITLGSNPVPRILGHDRFRNDFRFLTIKNASEILIIYRSGWWFDKLNLRSWRGGIFEPQLIY